MANVKLVTDAVARFVQENVFAQTFDLKVVGVDSDIMALGDSFRYTYLDTASITDADHLDDTPGMVGKVDFWDEPVLKEILLPINKHLNLAFKVDKAQEETAKTVKESLEVAVDKRNKKVEVAAYAAALLAAAPYGGTALDPTDLSSTDKVLGFLTDLESYMVSLNIPENQRVLITAPHVGGRFNLGGLLMTKDSAYVNFKGYNGSFGSVVTKSWNGITAVEGVVPVLFGFKNALATGVLIDEIIRDDKNVQFPSKILYSGVFDYGVGAIQRTDSPGLFVTYVSTIAPVS